MKLPFAHPKVKKHHCFNAAAFCFFLFIQFLATPLSFADSPPPLSAWVIRWHMDSPEEINAICREAEGSFDNLLVQVRGRADAYYKSNLIPRAEELNARHGFDPLAEILDTCSQHHIQAWMNVYYLWTGTKAPRDPRHPAHFEKWRLMDNNGRMVSDYSEIEQAQNWIEGVYADPASTEYRQLFVSAVKELVETYPVAGIHLDFVRYPGASFGHGGNLTEDFMQAWGFDPRLLPETITSSELTKWHSGQMDTVDSLLTTGALIWADMRSAQVTALVRQVRQALDDADSNLVLSAAIFPDYIPAYLEKGQDWLSWSEEGLVDELYPMTYFGGRERVTKQIEHVEKLCRNSPVLLWAGLGAYIKTSDEIDEEAARISQFPIQGFSLFSLGHLLQKNQASKPYVQSLQKRRLAVSGEQKTTNTPDNLVKIIKDFKKIRQHAPVGDKTRPQLASRMNEFQKASATILPRTVNNLEQENRRIPRWLEMQGVFRYVHPYDSDKKKDDQKKLCRQARVKMVAGLSMNTISKEFSQAGSKHFQSLLPRYYLTEDNEKDKELAKLMEGEISRVFLEENGYRCYKIINKGGGDLKTWAEMPWPARRILFREALKRMANERLL